MKGNVHNFRQLDASENFVHYFENLLFLIQKNKMVDSNQLNDSILLHAIDGQTERT
jgi:hypothetical protein